MHAPCNATVGAGIGPVIHNNVVVPPIIKFDQNFLNQFTGTVS